jgi:hypothetical protein
LIICLAYSTVFDFTSEGNERFTNIGNSTAKGFHKYKSGKGFHSFITVADYRKIVHLNIGEYFTQLFWQYSIPIPATSSWKASSVLGDFYFEETNNILIHHLDVCQSLILISFRI